MRMLTVLILILFSTSVWGQSLEETRRLAKQGNTDGQLRLGLMYRDGAGVPQDDIEAVKWFCKLAVQGYTEGQVNMGLMYREGRGVSQDYAEAMKWFRMAANQGNAVGQRGLGVMYEEGNGVPRNYRRAHMWYNIAVSLGDRTASIVMESLEGIMTAADINTAQQLARRCLQSNYKDCD